MADKIRLDVFMKDSQMTKSRQQALDMIKKGQVTVNQKVCQKSGYMIDPQNDEVKIIGDTLKYVGRGGLKLEKAISEFLVNLSEKCAMDIGASTGGFTDCMLKNGAKKVYAVDVGCGQLAPELLEDKRVVNMENTNIRYVTLLDIGELVDFISIDVSFISLELILPVASTLLKENGELVALVKPQFEAGKKNIGKKGVVKDLKVHKEVCNKVFDYAKASGFCVKGFSYSPITGSKGNIEYLIYLVKSSDEDRVSKERIFEVVFESHKNL